MWRNWNSWALLVGMSNGATSTKNSSGRLRKSNVEWPLLFVLIRSVPQDVPVEDLPWESPPSVHQSPPGVEGISTTFRCAPSLTPISFPRPGSCNPSAACSNPHLCTWVWTISSAGTCTHTRCRGAGVWGAGRGIFLQSRRGCSSWSPGPRSSWHGCTKLAASKPLPVDQL